MSVWAGVVLVCALSGCSRKSVAPDPDAALYGTWSGRMEVDFGTGMDAGPLTLEISGGSMTVTWGVNRVPAHRNRSLHDPTLHFSAEIAGANYGFYGLRVADTLSGNVNVVSTQGYPPIPLGASQWRAVR